MSHEAIDTVRAIYDAIGAGDTAAIAARFAADVRIEQTPELPWGGVYDGLAGFAKFSATLRAHIESRVAIDTVFAAGADIVVIGHTIGKTKQNGAAFEVAIAHVLTVADGKVTRARYFIDTPAMLAALGPQETMSGA